jgi:hypothetical protein
MCRLVYPQTKNQADGKSWASHLYFNTYKFASFLLSIHQLNNFLYFWCGWNRQSLLECTSKRYMSRSCNNGYLTDMIVVMWKWPMECEPNKARPEHGQNQRFACLRGTASISSSSTNNGRVSNHNESRLEGVNRANLKFTNLSTTTSRVSVRNKNESKREGAKQIVSE